MKIFTCLVVAPDIRRSVVTIPGCKTQKEREMTLEDKSTTNINCRYYKMSEFTRSFIYTTTTTTTTTKPCATKCHKHLAYPSFQYLSTLFPSLLNKDCSVFLL